MRPIRRSAAWLLLAAAVFGGTVAPAVHRVAHGLEREAVLAAHAADGHHVAGETGTHVREACTLRATDDLACTVCQGLSATVIARGESEPDVAGETRAWPEAAARVHGAGGHAAASRGPPGGVA